MATTRSSAASTRSFPRGSRAFATPLNQPARPATARLVLAFGAVYLIWGSTYLAIRIAIATLPPFTMAGARFLTAGALLYVWARWIRRADPPTAQHWRNTSLLGALLVLGGNGLVVWAEQWVPSGLAALLVGTLPIWMVLTGWAMGVHRRPGARLVAGLVWGFLGVALLASSGGFSAGGRMGLIGGLAVMTASLSWSIGSVQAKRVALPSATTLVSAMEMLWGGVWLLVVAAASGELGRLGSVHPSLQSLLAVAYLALFGSVIAFSAFVWLNSVTTPALLTTYAYVNPVVALLLGWAVADEPVTGRTVLAALVILSAVVVITREDHA